MTTVHNSGVQVCCMKGIVSVCFLDAQLGLWVSLEDTFTCLSTTNQAEVHLSTAHLLARWEHERTTSQCSRQVQGGGLSVIPTAGIHYKLSLLLT